MTAIQHIEELVFSDQEPSKIIMLKDRNVINLSVNDHRLAGEPTRSIRIHPEVTIGAIDDLTCCSIDSTG